MDNINNEHKMCTHCVMDTTDKNIIFDENGVCNRCNEYEKRIKNDWNYGKGHDKELQDLILKIKKSGKGKKYDCILGLSGGLDSSYMLHLAVKEWGLRPFVLHVDCGWDMPLVMKNINNLCNKLKVDLHIEKLNFEEIRKMQIAFFKSGLPGLDVPQDHAFIAQVDRYAQKLNVKYILNGYNISTEIISDPASWFQGCGPTADKTYVKDVLKKQMNFKTKDYIYTTGFRHKFWLPYIKGIKTVQVLNFVPLTKKKMISDLMCEYDYIPYEQKHFEDELTKFIEGWWWPTRFGYDIRRAQLSSLVITNQISRQEAIDILARPMLSDDESKELFSLIAKKLKISEDELMSYHELPKTYLKYKSKSWAFDLGIKIYTFLGLDKRIRK